MTLNNRLSDHEYATPYLLLVSERQATDGYPIHPLQPVVIGRSTAARLRLNEDNVSRRHARISYVNDAYFIEDLNSTNGTYLNGRRLTTAHKLHQNDIIGVGKTLLVFATDAASDPQTAAALIERIRLDPLTGLLTRAFFIQQLCGEFSRTERAGATVCLLLCNLDNFSALNETYGYSDGDQVLRQVGQTVCACVRQNVDRVARYSSEAFGIVMPRVAPEFAVLVAEKIRMSVARLPLTLNGKPYRITASIGVGASGGKVATPEALLALTANNLLQAKVRGKNRVEA